MPTNSVERVRDILVRPFSLGGLTLPNRVVMAPMTREFSPAACRATTWRSTTPGGRPPGSV